MVERALMVVLLITNVATIMYVRHIKEMIDFLSDHLCKNRSNGDSGL